MGGRLQPMLQQRNDVLAAHITIQVNEFIGHFFEIAEKNEKENFERLCVLKNDCAVGLVFFNVLLIVDRIFCPMRLWTLVVLHVVILIVNVVLPIQNRDAVLVDILRF